MIENKSSCPDPTAMRLAALAVDTQNETLHTHGMTITRKALKTQVVYTVEDGNSE